MAKSVSVLNPGSLLIPNCSSGGVREAIRPWLGYPLGYSYIIPGVRGALNHSPDLAVFRENLVTS